MKSLPQHLEKHVQNHYPYPKTVGSSWGLLHTMMAFVFYSWVCTVNWVLPHVAFAEILVKVQYLNNLKNPLIKEFPTFLGVMSPEDLTRFGSFQIFINMFCVAPVSNVWKLCNLMVYSQCGSAKFQHKEARHSDEKHWKLMAQSPGQNDKWSNEVQMIRPPLATP